ncbi:MAG: hypothetical protein F4Y01_02865 [Gammaproteobacteria bacterium]|nr:hypothetical protein [Gammaproteobacteria bacterium]
MAAYMARPLGRSRAAVHRLFVYRYGILIIESKSMTEVVRRGVSTRGKAIAICGQTSVVMYCKKDAGTLDGSHPVARATRKPDRAARPARGDFERCRCEFVEVANVDEAEPSVTSRAAIQVTAVRNAQGGIDRRRKRHRGQWQ